MHILCIPGDPKKSDPAESVIEKRVRGRLKCFKRCSVAKKLPYIRIIFCNFFRHSKFSKLKILRKMACLKSSKSRQKQGNDLQPFQIFKTMWSVFNFRLGIGNSVESFQNEFIVPRYLRYSCLKGQGYFCFFVKNSCIARKVKFLSNSMSLLTGNVSFPILRYLGTINFLWKLLTELPIPSLK